jgi:sporulation protein YlmC with PRC-barrel domain
MKRHALLLTLLVSTPLVFAGAAQADPPTPVPPAASAPVPPTPASPAPEPAKPTPPPPAPTAKVAASGILGRKVLGPDGKEIGRVVDVLVDAGSNPRAVVIDVGGFLGVGARRIAVNWSDLTFPPTGSDVDIKLDLTSEQISSAPAYTDQTKPATVVEPPPLKPALPAPPAGH